MCLKWLRGVLNIFSFRFCNIRFFSTYFGPKKVCMGATTIVRLVFFEEITACTVGWRCARGGKGGRATNWCFVSEKNRFWTVLYVLEVVPRCFEHYFSFLEKSSFGHFFVQ